MKNVQRVRDSLLKHLSDNGIQFSQISRDELKGKAVVEFAFNLGVPPSILWGTFKDVIKEVISVAHEAGHVTVYNKMSRQDAVNYLCTMFAAHGIGLEKISLIGQECILDVEAEASATGIRILMETGVDNEDLEIVKAMMSEWYAGYEKLCHKEVVKKVREKMLESENMAFLVSHQTGHKSD